MENSGRIRRLTIRNWLFIGLSALVSACLGYRYGSLLETSAAALAGIVSVFSILAGVLVAVISIIGDPSMLLTGNWRVGYVHAEQTQIRLARYAHLVFLYFLILVFVLAATIVKDNQIKEMDALFQILMGLTAFALILSLPLPYTLMAIQKERMREEVKGRRVPTKEGG